MALYQLVDKDGQVVGTHNNRQSALRAVMDMGPQIMKTKKELVDTEEVEIEGTPFSLIVKPDTMVEEIVTVPLTKPRPEVIYIKHKPSGELFRPGARAYALFEQHLSWKESID